jgi:GNAT superfamily N-acetyltransferase
VTPATKSLGLLIRKAVWLGKGTPPSETPGQHVEDVALPAEVASVHEAPSLAAVPAASPVTAPTVELDAQVSSNDNADEVVMSFGDRRYRVRGLAKNLSPETLKVNVLVNKAEAYHVDSFDLYAARARAHYITQATKELAVREDVIKLDLGRVLLKLEALQAERIKAAMKVEPEAPKMSEAEAAEALALLRSPELLTRIVADFEACGLVGEATNKLVGYLAATSRKLGGPLAIVVQSSSAAGKSSLMDAVLAFMPEEERIKYSAMTGQSLFYMGQNNLKHKILAIAEEEGASRASYALKLLQSEGELTIASTGKDASTGNLVTQQYHVEGPVMIFLTTTAIEIDEELLNRCIVLSVDEGRAQTEAIHRLQRLKRTLEGLRAKQDKARLIRLHQNAQRLLRPLAVVNPYADRLTFLSDQTRTRRDHEKYLTLIDTIALLHQHQRPVRTMLDAGQAIEYIEATVDDIAQANAIAHEVLGRSLDELPPQTRLLLVAVVEHVRAQVRESALRQLDVRKDVRELTGWGDTQLKVHLARLAELEYLLTHRAERGQGFAYELLFDGDAAAAVHLSGLIDVDGLGQRLNDRDYDAQRSGQNAERSAPGRGVVGQRSGAVQSALSPAKQALARLGADEAGDEVQTHALRPNGKHPSYVPASPSLAAEVRR